LYNLHSKSVFISRNVIFYEHIFPFATNLIHPNSDSCFFSSPSPHIFPNSTSFVQPCVSPTDSSSLDFPSSPSVSTPSDSTSTEISPSSPNPFSAAVEESIPIDSALHVSRKSTITRRPPEYLQHYHYHMASTSPELVSKASHFDNSGIPFPLSSLMIISLLLSNIFACPYRLKLNLSIIIRQLNMLIGVLLWLKKLQPLKKIILGMSLICLLASTLLAANGYIKLRDNCTVGPCGMP